MCRCSLVVAPVLLQGDPLSTGLRSIASPQHKNAEKRKEARGTIWFLRGGRGRAWPEPLIMITGRLMKDSFSRCPHDVTCHCLKSGKSLLMFGRRKSIGSSGKAKQSFNQENQVLIFQIPTQTHTMSIPCGYTTVQTYGVELYSL